MTTTFALQTPRPMTGRAASGAIAIIQLNATDADTLDQTLAALDVAPIAVGDVRQRTFSTIDNGVVARPSQTVAQLMPHGGAAILQRMCQWLVDAGVEEASGTLPPVAHTDAIERAVIEVMTSAPSPAAIRVLLRQRDAWRTEQPFVDDTTAAHLDHLLTPPRVAVIGPANVGKSTLLNALAGRHVALTADLPGTTRDHVGVNLILDGLVVQWLDLPGLREIPDAIEAAAWERASTALADIDVAIAVVRTVPPPTDCMRGGSAILGRSSHRPSRVCDAAVALIWGRSRMRMSRSPRSTGTG